MTETLREQGNVYFRNGEYLLALEKYENAIEIDPENHLCLSNMAGCYIKTGRFTEAIEIAQKVIKLVPDWVRGYQRLSMAYFGLAEYVKAKKILKKAIVINPDDDSLVDDMVRINAVIRENGIIEREPAMTSDDFECVLCLKLMYEPVTTPCGHTFCKECLMRSLDHSQVCPMCRRVLHYSLDHPVNITMNNIIQKYFPEEYQERLNEVRATIDASTEQIPLFYLNTVAYPGREFPMHIFEPRYRLMMRRCMAGSRRFGLINHIFTEHEHVTVGTVLEITDIRLLPDGRSYISTIAADRFKVLEEWELDGYKMGRVELIEDVQNDTDFTTEAEQVKTTLLSLLPRIVPPTALSELTTMVGAMDATRVDEFIWNVIRIFPFPELRKHLLLLSSSLQERITLVKQYLEETV